jgi:mono/diheme cytochrome c family protein
MIKRLILAGAIATTSVTIVLYAQTPATSKPTQKAAIASPAAEHELFEQYCFDCHAGPAPEAGLHLDKLDTAHVEKDADKWELVVRKLRAGMMPPSGMERPDVDTREAMITWLENELDQHRTAALPPPGLHRLNRTEYANVIRDLLAIEVDASKYLPSDDSTRGFDNVAAGLSLSPALLEGYTSAAGKISRLAVGDVSNPMQTVFRVPEDTSQDYHLEGMPFGTRGGLIAKYEFPADGDYSIKITPISKGNMGDTNPFGEIVGEKLEFLLDGQRLKLFDWDKDRVKSDGTYNFKFPATGGLHTVVVTFVATNYAPGNDLDQHFLRSTIETGGLPGFKFFPHVGKITIDGPGNPKGAAESASRKKIFICTPSTAEQEAPCARKIVSALARHAFRRPVAPADMDMLMGFYQQGRKTGTFDNGVEMALRRILVDPEFIFRKETEPESAKPGEPYRISDLELASRLSFFLWSSIPDDELLKVAGENRLHEPAVLDKEVRRMLSDPRSDQLVVNVAGQWLQLRGLQTQSPVTAEFPDFDDNLRRSMRKETELFVDSVVHEDHSVLDLLDGNWTYLNERLAKHYGIPNVYGSHFRRVVLPPEFDYRRGLLGKASIETVTAYPNRTSPTVRGKTIMAMFLGVTPPNPPPNVPALKETASTVHGGQKPTMRQQMEAHRVRADCVSCHKIMDPIGFALENFDAVGAWRTTDDGNPIDAAGQLVDGTKINGAVDLRNALKRYSPQFVRLVTEKLMIYALGRGTEYFDMPLIRSVVHEAAKTDYRFSSLVLGIVKSDPFQMNQKVQISSNAPEKGLTASR